MNLAHAFLHDLATRAIAADTDMAEPARILRSICGIGAVTIWMLIARLPEPGHTIGELVVALTRLAPIAHDSGALRGK